MKRFHKSDGDGVDAVDQPEDGELHENVRKSTDGVEKKAAGRGARPAAGLIGGGASGAGEMVDPRYIAPR